MKLKRIMAMVLCVAMVLSMMGVSVSAEEATATETSDVIISTIDDLKTFRDSVNGGNTYAGRTVVLNANIDISSEADWAPIGIKGEIGFAGIFDGNNKEISGLSITENNERGEYVALFGAIDSPAVVKNLTVSGNVTGKNSAGIIARMNGGKVENCINNVNVVDPTDKKAGGVVCLAGASAESVITGCINNGSVAVINNATANNNDLAGGILGYVSDYNVTVSDCVNNGEITANEFAAGIVGYVATRTGVTLTVTNNKNTGKIKAISASGIIGFLGTRKDATVSYNTNEGTVIGFNNRNGIASWTTANPDDGTNTDTGILTDTDIVYVAKIGEVEYTDLQTAIDDAAKSGDTVTLMSDVTYTTVYTDNKTHWNGDLNYELGVSGTVVLDLNGYTINSTGLSTHAPYAVICVRSGSLTIKDSSDAKTGAIILDKNNSVQTEKSRYTIYNNGNLELNGGTISNLTGGYAIESVTVKNTSLTINDGANVTSTGIAVRACSQGSTGTQVLTINGGTISGTYALWVPLKNGSTDVIDLTINGGSFTGSSNAILVNSYVDGDFTTDSIKIAGGEFNGNVLFGSQYSEDENNIKLSAALAENVISGGTFSNDVSEYVADGFVLDEDGSVVESAPAPTTLSYAQFNELVRSAEGGVYDGNDITVVLKDSERSYQNNETAQFFVGGTNVNITDPVEVVKVSNVNFVFEDDDTANTYTSGELQVFAKVIEFTDCTFTGVAVSPWGVSNAENAESATFTNCVWNDLSGRYGVHQNRASALTVTDCEFINCERGIHTNSSTVSSITITGNTFTGIGAGYGVLCLAEGNGDLSKANLDISDNNAEGQVMLRQLSSTVTYEQVSDILDTSKNTYGTAYVSGSIEPVATAVAKVNGVEYYSIADALADAKAGDEIVLLADVEGNINIPADVTFNGNNFAVNGTLYALGDITFAGHTKVTTFDFENVGTEINIGVGACLEITGTGRMVIGHGCTFNIEGNIENAKTANVADLTPSLIAAGASFTGDSLNFNVKNAYIKFTAYCSSKNSNASGTFNFNVANSVWEQSGSLVFSEPTNGKDPTFNFNLKDSVLNSTSHLVFAVTKGEIVFDNSYVNKDAARQLENRSTMTIKNGSVVCAAVATSQNAKNPGTTIVDNATYNTTGEFSGAEVGTGTLIVKNNAKFSTGKITKANVTIDAAGLTAGQVDMIDADLSGCTGTLSVVNNNLLEAKIENGEIVLVAKPAVAKIGDTGYASVADALAAAQEQGLTDVTITLVGETTRESALAAEDSFNLSYGTAFENVTIKQEDPSKVYYIDTIYTGDRTSTDGKFVFDGVNIEITSQIWFECPVVLKNNSTVTRYQDVKNFIYYGDVTIEPGSKFNSVIDDVFAGSITVDGGMTDGTYNETPGYRSTYLDVRAGHTLTLKNGAYALFNAANEVGRLILYGNAHLTDSKMDVYNNIILENNSCLSLDTESVVSAKVITGSGVITVDASELKNGSVTVINADMSGFTGTVSVTGNDDASYKITDAGLVVSVPTSTLTNAYTSENTYWGECGGNASESFVFKFYHDDTYMGYTSLADSLIDGDVYVSWHIKLDAESNTDECWEMAWDIAPTLDMQPNRVEHWVDGVCAAECPIEPNWSDRIFPVTAAVADADGKIVKYVNNRDGNTLEKAFADAQDGQIIALLRDVKLNGTLSINKNITIDGNDKVITPADNFVSNGHNAVLVFEEGITSAAIKNITFNNFSGLTRVVRANFAEISVEGCSFNNNNVTEGVITSAYADLTVDGCEFNNNTSGFAVINIGSDVSNGTDKVADITNNTFVENNAAIAVVYAASSANVTGNRLSGNIHTGDNANAAAILAGPYTGNMSYTININENAFVDAMSKGEAALPAVFAEDWSSLGSTTAFDLSSNYWNGGEPADGYATSGENPDVTLDDYYTSYEDGILGGLEDVVLPFDGTNINNLEDLKAFRDSVNEGTTYANKTVVLNTDIDLNNEAWLPIGTNAARFKGTFDGQNHTISNLYISNGDLSYAGLFGYADGAKINNVKINNVDIYAYSNVGSVVGCLYTGSVSNCHVSGTISLVSQYAYAGGITGYGYNNIYDCSVIATGRGVVKVNEKTGAGGIVGWHTEGNLGIYRCTAKNLDITAWTNLGGITGFVHYDNTIDGCTVENVTLTKTRVDGQAGIGLIAGGWQNKSDDNYTITITNNTLNNITMSGTAINSHNQLYGSNYSYYDKEIKLDDGSDSNAANSYENIVSDVKVVVNKEADLEKALAYCNEGEIIYVGSAFEVSKSLTVTNNLTLEFGEFAVTFAGGGAIVLDEIGATLAGPANLNVTTSVADSAIEYVDGVYTVVKAVEEVSKNLVLFDYPIVENEGKEYYRVAVASGIKSTSYAKVGFEVTIGDAETVKVFSTVVYRNLRATIDGVDTTLAAADFGAGSQYINFTNLYFNTELYEASAPLTIRPFAVKFNGDYEYGKETTIDAIYTLGN